MLHGMSLCHKSLLMSIRSSLLYESHEPLSWTTKSKIHPTSITSWVRWRLLRKNVVQYDRACYCPSYFIATYDHAPTYYTEYHYQGYSHSSPKYKAEATHNRVLPVPSQAQSSTFLTSCTQRPSVAVIYSSRAPVRGNIDPFRSNLCDAGKRSLVTTAYLEQSHLRPSGCS